MKSTCGVFNDKYAWAISGLHKMRNFKDGIDFFELKFNLDLFKGDHNPQCRLLLEIFNFKIIEIEVYNINHKE